MTGKIGRIIIIGWLGGVVLLLTSVVVGNFIPARVLITWSEGARGGEEVASLLDLRGRQVTAYDLPQSMPLAQQAILNGCSAHYYILEPESPIITFYSWDLSGSTMLNEVAYPSTEVESTVRIWRRAISPDGRWLFLPYDRLGIVLDQESRESYTLIVPEEEPISAGQPGYWSPDSRWLLWPYEVNGQHVLWLRFDTQTQQVATIEAQGQPTFITETRWGVWSPDSSLFATLHHEETDDGSSHAELLLLNPEDLSVQSYSYTALSNEYVWSPDSSALVIFASQENAQKHVPTLLNVQSGEQRVLVNAGYPAPNIVRAGAYTPTWSPDGTLLTLFTSEEPSQSATITLHIVTREGEEQFAAPLESRARMGAEVQFWSADGQQFALFDQARGALTRYEIRSGTAQEFGGGMQRIISVLPEDEALILIETTRPGRNIQRLSWQGDSVVGLHQTTGAQATFTLCETGA